jgi:alpha-1,3-rhamnosyl/mannosyltransferase
MRIGIDGAPLRPPFTGVGNYELYLLDALTRLDPTLAFDAFDAKGWRAIDRPALDGVARAFGKTLEGRANAPGAAPPQAASGRGLARVVEPLRRAARATPLAHRAYHALRRARFARSVGRRGIDVFHAFAYLPPGPCAAPTIPVIYDMSITRHADTHPAARVRHMAPMYDEARRAAFVHTISQFSKREIVELIGLPPDKVAIAYPGASAAYLAPPRDVAGALSRHGLASGAFALTVSTIEPRKNLKTLVTAFARLPPAARRAMPLMVVGAKGWGDVALPPGAAELIREGSLRFLGYVSEDDLAALYATCRAMFYPSLYEGFGMPIVEAMALGAPVVASDAASMPEAAGAHGRLVAPLDVDAWTEALRDVAEGDGDRAKAAVAARRAHAESFSWEAAAGVVRDLYARLG